MIFATVAGQRRTASPGLHAVCPGCGAAVIPKCGAINAWHWAHVAGADCDPWTEPTGPWHLSWQNAVDPRAVEAPFGKHRADIVGNDGVVVELQHSAISADQIRDREAHYGRMVWLFDATHRFRFAGSGEWAFFSLGRTRHLPFCRQPVFLDFGDQIVEVASFSDVFPEFDGIGIARDRSWFAKRYLSEVLVDEIELVRSDDLQPDPWAERRPFRPVGFPTKWFVAGEPRLFPASTEMLVLDDLGRRRPIAHDVIDGFTDLANGWSKSSLKDMQDLLHGDAVILDGLLRVMPALKRKSTVAPLAVYSLLADAEDHVRAGRIPILKDSTKRAIRERKW